jgi:hypothetical protein
MALVRRSNFTAPRISAPARVLAAAVQDSAFAQQASVASTIDVIAGRGVHQTVTRRPPNLIL